MSNVFKIGDKVRRVLHDTESVKIGDMGVVCEALYSPEDGAEIRLEGKHGLYCEDFFELVSRKEEEENNMLNWIQAAEAIDAGKEIQVLRPYGKETWIDVEPKLASVYVNGVYRLKPREFKAGWYLYNMGVNYATKMVYFHKDSWFSLRKDFNVEEKYVGRYLGLDPIDFVK